MGKKSLTKGKRGEYELRDKLRSYGFPDVQRGSVFTGTQDVYNLLGIHVECKVCSEIRIRMWLSQAITSSEKRKDGLPVVMYRQVDKTHRGLPWLVTMRRDDWVSIGGKIPFASPRNVSIYERMEKTKEAGETSRVDYYEDVGAVITMYLDNWIELYRNWKLPFTED